MPENISITSANAKLTLTVRNNAGIVVGPFTVEGYAEDAAFATEPVEVAETKMGVDGKMAAGRIPAIKKQVVSLMANSPSNQLFEAWLQAQEALGDILVADGVVAAPSLQKAWLYVKGVLTRITPTPTARKTFSEPVTWQMDWESVIATPITV